MKQKKFFLSADQIPPLAPDRGACIATDLIVVGGSPVRFMYREEPDSKLDSGWRFMAGQETQAYMDDPDNLALYDINTIANYDASIIPFLDAPIGSAFEKLDAESPFVAVTDWIRGNSAASERPSPKSSAFCCPAGSGRSRTAFGERDMSEADRLADDIILNGFAVAESRLDVSVLDRLRRIPTEQLASSAAGATRISSDGGSTRVRLIPDCPDLWPLHQDQLLLAVAARVLRNPFTLKYLQSRTVHPEAACQTLHMDCDAGTEAGKLLAFIWMLDAFRHG